MTRQRFLEVFGGLVIALFGLGILARLDLPYLAKGGWPAVAAGLELFAAILILSLALGTAEFKK